MMEEIKKSLKKTQRGINLGVSSTRGRIAEGLVEGYYRPRGYIKKVHKGRDFDFREVNPLTGEVGPLEMIEVKAGRSTLSKSQRKMQRKMKKRYRVVRVPV